jgi:kynurenine 3-monooxygenase
MVSPGTFHVAGAGLCGALMALLLARRGHPVEVWERRSDPREGTGEAGRSINLALSVRGLTALRAAGLADEVLAQALPMRGRMLHGRDGTLTHVPYGRAEDAIWSVSRAGLNRLLIEAAARHPGVSIHFGAAVQGLDASAGVLEVRRGERLDRHPLGESYLIAADGAWSAVRGNHLRRDRFSYTQQYISHGYRELTVPAGADEKFQLAPDSLHIWPRGDFMMIALPNPDRTFTCTLFLRHDGATESFAALEDARYRDAFFGEHFGDLVPLLGSLGSQFARHPRSSLHWVKCAPWDLDHRGVLLGDAAHAIVPFYGQGMNAAFEDCMLLDGLLASLDREEAPGPAVAAWAERRRVDTDAICDLALDNFVEMRATTADPAWQARKALEGAFMECFPETYRDLYGLVSFTTVPYDEARRQARAQTAHLDEHPATHLGMLSLGLLRRLAVAPPD